MSADVNNSISPVNVNFAESVNGPSVPSENSPSPNLSRFQSQATSIGSEEPILRRRQRTSLLYWSSLTPLFCGGIGPTLTLLALSGCLDHWRVYEMPDGSSTSDRDPHWVVGVTALAIIVGFIANILLLLRMIGRGNPKLLQLWAILLWLLESVLNFATIGVYVQIVGDDGPWEYAQGFWMTVCSAAMSSICAFLLGLNSFILPEFGHRGKMGLSGPQRVFVIQIMVFVILLGAYFHLDDESDYSGAALFYGIEKFTFSESVYFCDVTVTTVGFGDNVVPSTTLGRALVMPYAIIGIISLGLLVSSIRNIVVERAHVRKKLVSLMLKKQQKRLDFLRKRTQRRQASMLGVSMMIMGSNLREINERSVEPLAQEFAREELRKKRLNSAEKAKEFYALLFSFISFLVLWVVGAAIFSTTEAWTYFEGLYFCMVFFLTIGYGDFVVTSNVGRAIYVVYSLLTIPIMTILISLMSDTFLSKLQEHAEKFGIRGSEDERYSRTKKMKELREQLGPRCNYYTRKILGRKVEKPTFLDVSPAVDKDKDKDKDIERGRVQHDDSADDFLRHEVMEEVEEIRRSADEEVDVEMGIGGGKPLHHGTSERVGGARRRRPIQFEDGDDDGDADDEGVSEEEVETAILETRGSKDV